ARPATVPSRVAGTGRRGLPRIPLAVLLVRRRGRTSGAGDLGPHRCRGGQRDDPRTGATNLRARPAGRAAGPHDTRTAGATADRPLGCPGHRVLRGRATAAAGRAVAPHLAGVVSAGQDRDHLQGASSRNTFAAGFRCASSSFPTDQSSPRVTRSRYRASPTRSLLCPSVLANTLVLPL